MLTDPFKLKQLVDFFSKYILLTPSEVMDIAGIVKYGAVKKDTLIVEEGKVTDRIAFILNGYARTFYFDQNGREMTTHFHWEYNLLVSPRSFFGRQQVNYNTIAMEKIDGLYVIHEEFIQLMKKHPRLEGIVKDILRDVVPDISDHVKLLQMVSTEERYERLIQSRPDIVKRVPQKHIATYLGMTTETLSRVRSRVRTK